jgi:DNA-binding transcriptional ArsR family regulator
MQALATDPSVNEAAYEARATLLRALAHPARLRMVEALADGEKCVCDLHKVVGSSLPTVSRHLAQMKAAGVVADRKQGQWVYYRLLVPCLLPALDCIDAALRSDSERRAACCSAVTEP